MTIVSAPLPHASRALSSPARWHSVPGSDPADLDYVVREHLVTSTARAFQSHPEGAQAVPGDAIGYTTRVLVLTPRDPGRTSGTVYLQVFPGFDFGDDDYNILWTDARRHIARRGHTIVAVTNKAVGAETLRAYDEDRYGAIDVPDDRVRWDMLADVAAQLRTPAAGGLVPALAAGAEFVVAVGMSQAASALRTYLGERLHEVHSRESGRDVFDAYLLAVSSGGWGPGGYIGIDQDYEHRFDDQLRSITPDPIAIDDPRRTIRFPPVPVIEILSEDEVVQHQWTQRPDSDDAHDRYRCYHIAARGHFSGLRAPTLFGAPRNVVVRHGFPRPVDEAWLEGTQFRHEATEALWAGFLENLDHWLRSDVPPPRADPIPIHIPVGAVRDPRGVDYRALTPLTDAEGHARGGVPYLQTLVPTAWMRRLPGDAVAGVGHWVRQPWPTAQLTARYGTRGKLAEELRASARTLVAQRWYLADDAEDAVERILGDLPEDFR